MLTKSFKLATVLALLSLVGPLTIDMYLPALPSIAEELKASVGEVHWTITAYLIGFGPAQLFYGPLSDQFGRKVPLYLGLSLFILGSIGCLLAPNIEVLSAARILQGFGGAVAITLPRAIVRDLHTGVQATRLMGFMMMVVSVSPMLAPLLGSAVLMLGDWRAIFFVLAAFAALCLSMSFWQLPETLAKEKRIKFGVSSFTRGTLRLFSDPTYMGLSLIGACCMTTFYVFIANASFVYTVQFGLSQIEFSIAFALNGFGFFLASRFAAPLAQRFGIPRLIRSCAAIFVTLMLTLTAILVSGHGSLAIVMAFFFVGYGLQGLIVPTAMVLSLERHGAIAGLASSWAGTLRVLITGVIIAMTEPFVDGTALPMTAIITCAGLMAFITSQIVLSSRREKLLMNGGE